MVKIEEPSDYDRLDRVVRKLCEEHRLKLDVNGWTRRVYDVYDAAPDLGPETKIASLDSHATRSGELVLFDDRGIAFVTALGTALEEQFGIEEARVIRRAPA